jgi:hypothetical protein
MLADRAGEHWCAFRRGGRPCNHAAVTYLVGERVECVSGYGCDDHARQMVGNGWRDSRG